MTDSFNNDGQVAERCEGKIKFSAICKALKEDGIDFDVPGCLLAADGEGAYSHVETDKEDEFNSHVFRMAGNACSRLVVEAFYFAKYGEHFTDEYKGFTNHLIYDCMSHHLPELSYIEKELQNLRKKMDAE